MIEVSLQAGEIFVRQGDPTDWMFIFLEGLFQWKGEFGGDAVSLPAQAGEVSGVFPFSRMKRFTMAGRAVTDGRLAKFPTALFPELMQKMPELTTRLVAMMSDRIREGTRLEQQRELAQLAYGGYSVRSGSTCSGQSAMPFIVCNVLQHSRKFAGVWLYDLT